MLDTQDGAIAAVSAIAGALGKTVLERIFMRGEKKIDAETAFREQLMQRVDKLAGELEAVRIEVDTWKVKYFDLLRDHVTLQAEQTLLKDEVQQMREELQSRATDDHKVSLEEIEPLSP